MESVDEAVRASGSRLVYLQAVVAKFAVLASCMVFSAVAVYPEAVLSSTASRTTEMPRVYTGSAETPLLTEEMVTGWVIRWQKRLSMEDWKIETRIVRLNQLPKGTVANIHWSLPRRTATIKVLDPIDSTLPRTEIVRDTELSVVHELVHLSMAKLPLDSANTELEEEAVKKLSTALLALDKATGNKPDTLR
jgi:hypothetical protein